MNNGITYFKLKSPYDGDITKNCALTGAEVDNNFFTLEGRDIQSVYVVDGKVIVNLKNGERLTTESITEGCVKNLDVRFDEVNGILTINKNGVTQTITGFATNYNIGDAVAVDGTLVGDGMSKKPIGISPLAKTGQYRPVKGFIKVVNGEKLPHAPYVFPGDRYLTQETVNEFGFLYNYEGVKKIACALKEFKSEWRVPTKEDWDDMLDAVEPSEFRDHTSATANKFLGHFAGKFLKSKRYWKDETHHFDDFGHHDHHHFDDFGHHHHDEHHHHHDHFENEKTCFDYKEECACGKPHTCHPTYCGEYGHCHHKHMHNDNGIDSYGFNVIPAGVADDGHNYRYFKERSYFWTATNHEYRNAYVKGFCFDKSSVLQDVFAGSDYLSLRLVKDFNGDNYNEREDILGGTYSTVLMPSMKHGKAVWTSVNISVLGCGCEGKHLIPNNNQGVKEGDVTKYFINEWTGKEWIRKEVLDGEVVVLAAEEKLPGGKTRLTYSELRLQSGHMVDVADNVYREVVDLFKPEIHDIKHNIHRIESKFDNAVTRLTETDQHLQEEIDDINKKMEQSGSDTEQTFVDLTERVEKNEQDIAQLNDDLKQTNENLATVNENLVTAINTINQNVYDGFTTINEAITGVNAKVDQEIADRVEAVKAEEDARIAADEEEKAAREQAITEETTAREEADAAEAKAREEADEAEKTAREEADEQEKQERIAADEQEKQEREEAIDAEAQARQTADTAEATAREEADTKLQEQIDEVKEIGIALDEKIEANKKAIEELDAKVDQEIADRVEAVKAEEDARIAADEEIQDKLNQEIADREAKNAEHEEKIEDLEENKVGWVDSQVITNNQIINRREVVLTNHSGLLGTDTTGGVYNLAMVSVWDVADFGSQKLHLNLNGKDRPTFNDSEELAYLSDIKELEQSNQEANDNLTTELKDLKKSLEDETTAREEADAAEAKAREEKDAELEAQLVKTVEFDEAKGQIIVKRVGENEEDIKVQLTMNFGKF